MKTVSTLIFLCLFLNSLYSQGCGFEADLSHETNLLKFDKSNWTEGDEIFNIKVYAHIITNSSGQGALTDEDVIQSIANLNQTFGSSIGGNYANSTNIQFHLSSCIDYFEYDGYNNNIDINQKDDGLDIYFFPDQEDNEWEGRAVFGSSRITIVGYFDKTHPDRMALTNALAHEVGHVFGLYHTWHNTANWLCIQETSGLDGIPDQDCFLPMVDEYFPEPVNIFDDTIGGDLNLRSKTGDYIADTPADPFKNFNATLPAKYNCVPNDFGPNEYKFCQRKTDCLDHFNRQYKYVGYEDVMFQGNIMSYAHVNCLEYFSADQITYMRHNLRGAMPHLKLLYEGSEDYSIVSDYKKIDCAHGIDYNITIMNGGVLEITKELYFSEGHGITVESGGELFLNGGTLTKALCDDALWNGVSSVNGSRIVIQEGKIEYAISGIDHSHGQFNFPTFSSPFDLNNAEFAHCTTGIKTRAKGGALYLEPNHVLNLLNIHDCEIGVDAERTEGMQITNSTFENNTDIGLKLSDGSMTVESSSFINMPIAISYNNMGGSVNSSTIGGAAEHNNVFYDNGQGIVANAPFSNDEFLVTHNTFLNNFIGLNVAGVSSSNILNNDFFGGIGGCGYSDGGGLENLIKDNLFTTNLIGTGSLNSNMGLLYTTNCFTDNSQGDIQVSGSINALQGNENIAASNKFSKITNVNSFKLEQAEDFDYFVKEGTPSSDERYPSGIDDRIEGSIDFEETNCGSTINPFPIINFYSCQCLETEEANIERIEELEQAINDLQSGSIAANPIFKRILIAKYTSCIEILEACIGKTKGYDEFEIAPDGKDRRDEYNTRTYPLSRVKTMSLLLSRGLWSEARSYLMVHSGEFDVYNSDKYEQLMTIYLDHIDDRSNASIHLQTLEAMAEEEHEFKGYARSMLCHYYKDCRFDLYGLDEGTPRLKKELGERYLSVYPNPSSTEITIESNVNAKLEIISSMGQVQKNIVVEKGDNKIDISSFPTGIYFVRSFSKRFRKVEVIKFLKI